MKISHGFEFIAFWLLTKMAQIMPAGLADRIALLLGKLAGTILTSRRRIAIDNLKRAYGGNKSDEDIDRIVRKVFINISRTSIEFVRLPVYNKDMILNSINEYSGLEFMDQALDHGKGLIFMMGHIGNWELLGKWISAKGYPTDFMVGKQHNPYVDRMFNRFRTTVGVNIIPIGLTARHVIKSLRANRVVAMMSDQHSATGGVIVDFFGRPASTPKGAAAFAVKTGSPIVLGSIFREKYNRHRVIIQTPIYPSMDNDTEAEIKRITQTYTWQLEEMIRLEPGQWMWTHRRWKADKSEY
jgi:Kdo2-lipid IVA lauroyltransferase/acyltransferase